MTDLIPFEFRGSRVRVVTINGEPWFVAGDVCFVLGYSNSRDAVAKHVREHQRGVSRIATPSGEQSANVISEPGLYRLMMRSHTVLADEFQDWVTDEVLPSIRKTGRYNAAELTEIEVARRYVAALEDKQRLEAQLAEQAPAVEAWNFLINAEGDYSVRESAQVLCRAGIDIGQKRLFARLRELEWLDRSGQPYQAQIQAGRIVSRATTYEHPNTGARVPTTQVRITGKGMEWLLNHLAPKPRLALVEAGAS